MNNINIKKVIKRLKKSSNGEITVMSVINYLSEVGYTVMFMNTKAGDELIKHYNLVEFGKGKRAFTYINKVHLVFVDNTLSYHDKLYSLLHELGHILLNHLGNNKSSHLDKRLLEAQAEAFVYAVMSPHKNKTALKITVLLVSAAVFFGTGMFAGHAHTRIADTTNKVIITLTGKSYHRKGCISINNKDYIFIPHADAEKIYAPCKICNPNITQ